MKRFRISRSGRRHVARIVEEWTRGGRAPEELQPRRSVSFPVTVAMGPVRSANPVRKGGR